MEWLLSLPWMLDKIKEVFADKDLTGIDLANFNSPGQIVISGPAAEISESLAPLKRGRCQAGGSPQSEWCFSLPNDGGTGSEIW